MNLLFQHFKWALCRAGLFVLFLLNLLIAVLAIGLYSPVGLLTSYCFFNDFRFWRYSRYYFPLVVFTFRMLWEKGQGKRYQFMLWGRGLTTPPQSGPDLTRFRRVNPLEDGENGCFPCIKCCKKITCPLLDRDQKQCLAYGSLFWRYFNCGPFPFNSQQLEYYECQRWEPM